MLRTVVLLLAFILTAPPAFAQVACNNRDKIIDWLGAKYKEALVATGVSDKGALVEVLTARDGTTWTILLTSPNGTSCIVETGQAWQTKPLKDVADDPQA
ncbi:MAG TPA: hypothetical protein VKN76_15130 [Kiloniellaceae bacterium]|nr:hypothetical protein [Kiloniellaceae bacterium]